MSCVIKVCLLLCLVSASSCHPALGIISDILGTGTRTAHPSSIDKGVVVHRHPLGILGKLIKGLTVVAGSAIRILKELTGISTFNGYGDIGNFLIRVGHAVGNIINQVLPNFGTFVSRLIEAVVRIVVCVGLTPARILIGGSPPPICTRAWGVKNGCHDYSGKYDTSLSVITGYNLDIKHWIGELGRKKYTGLKGSLGIIVKEVLIIAKLTLNLKTKIIKNDLLLLFAKVTTILAVIGESLEPRYGVTLVDSCFSLLGNVFGKDCKECESHRRTAKDRLKGCEPNDFKGSLKRKDGNGDKNDSSEENKNHDSENKNKRDSEENKEHDKENKKKNDSEKNKKHDSETKKNPDSEEDKHNDSGNKKEHGSEKNKKHDSETKKEHDSEENKEHETGNKEKHDSENNKKHDSKNKKTHDSEENKEHDSKNKGT